MTTWSINTRITAGIKLGLNKSISKLANKMQQSIRPLCLAHNILVVGFLVCMPALDALWNR